MIDDNDLKTDSVVKVATDVCILICVHAGVVLILYDEISVYNFKDRNCRLKDLQPEIFYYKLKFKKITV